MATEHRCERHPRSRTTLLATALVLLVALSASACGDGGTPTPAITGPGGTSAGPLVADGEHFGFLVDVTADHMLFDPADVLSGDAALEAARAEGFIGPDESLDNDFYISNLDERAADLQVDAAATFTLLVADTSGSPVEKTVTYADLVSLWHGVGDGDVYYSGLAQGFSAITVPINLTIVGGRVTGGSEQYLP